MKTSLALLCLVGAGHELYAQQAHRWAQERESEKVELMQTDAEFSRRSQEEGIVKAFLSYMAEDATLFPGGSDPVTGRESIRSHLSRDSAGVVLTWEPLKAEVAGSGDLGYTYGTYEHSLAEKDGNSRRSHGKYVTIWRKQSDGSWKFILDIGNQSPPPRTK